MTNSNNMKATAGETLGRVGVGSGTSRDELSSARCIRHLAYRLTRFHFYLTGLRLAIRALELPGKPRDAR
jgi:hypothetical protein